MKYLIISDIHGAIEPLKMVLNFYEKNKCDKLIILGDILYHGPRNDLPISYHPKEVVCVLNSFKDNIIAIKGNCDAEVDEMVLTFDLKECLDINLNGYNVLLSHGHHLDKHINSNTKIVFYGHTHIKCLEKKDNVLYLNPGSISIPKDKVASFAIMDGDILMLYDLKGNILKKFSLKEI